MVCKFDACYLLFNLKKGTLLHKVVGIFIPCLKEDGLSSNLILKNLLKWSLMTQDMLSDFQSISPLTTPLDET